MDPALMPDF